AVWPPVKLSDGQGGWNADYDKLRKEHWAFQPLTQAAVPPVADTAWPRDDIDRFVLARLEQEKLSPVADADKAALLRRVTADLTGLLPTPAEVDAFVADDSPQAFETVVDRLLASPAFGERWGRHWLDVARFGESTGSARNLPYPHAWRYRDYVIDAFNKDKPYDQFLREQIAGDLLPADAPALRDEQLIATGFLALGVKDVNQRFKVRFIMDNIDEQIDTVTRAALGLTVSCARCHDHKFDPVPATDYYAIAGIFHSTDNCSGLRNKMGGGGLDYYDTSLLVTLGGESATAGPELEAQIAKAKAEFEEARKDFQKIQGTPEGLAPGPNGRPKQQQLRQKMNRKQAELNALTDPAARGNVAHGVRDAKSVGDTEIRVRGEAEKLGPVVPRGFLTAVQVPNAAPINPAQSGRLELAQWITSPENPLASRVIVNRIWQHVFGAGLVSTVDNFGVTGDTPSHPELLDYLAAEFVRDGWSTKRLVRRLLLTRTYQLSAQSTEAHLAVDPQNRLLWRHAPRRLDAEEIRDGMLAAAGQLDPSRPEKSPSRELKVIELRNNGPEAAGILSFAKVSRSRSIYLPLLRTLVPGSLEVFDFAEQGMVTGRRDTTTVAPQALYLLNDPFVLRQSFSLADTLLADASLDDDRRVQQAFRTILGRPATASELSRARFFLGDYQEAAGEVLAAVETNAESAPADASAPEALAAVPASNGGVAAVVNPDDVEQTSAAIADDVPRPRDARQAAWAGLVQVLFGSAEFRYLQ
ncbi:MAG TPA: DUF1549 and DUF1553 domain-containing protein, partial [Planctomycetaceae bacterium]|nr:DUF1549 and DUF1553 domain-containing protein [Planctomycetaceae bacterium]